MRRRYEKENNPEASGRVQTEHDRRIDRTRKGAGLGVGWGEARAEEKREGREGSLDGEKNQES